MSLVCLLGGVSSVASAGVATLITHGFDSSAADWVTTMGAAVAAYPRTVAQFGTNTPVYLLQFNGAGQLTQQRVSGPPPASSTNASGDLILLLDWNPYSGDLNILFEQAESTTAIGPVVAASLADPGFIPELGAPLVRYPLHLIGHSRGGSLVCEIAKSLGERGITVDEISPMDPHPLNNDGFQGDYLDSLVDVTDGTVLNGVYDNVLYADVIYEVNSDATVPNGTAAMGAYNRYDGQVSPGGYNPLDGGGYANPHSNAHLWYFGTLEVEPPGVSDGSATLSAATRQAWYAPGEQGGLVAGYWYSLRGGGDRRSTAPPPNASSTLPVDGLNGLWGAALAVPVVTNRQRLGAPNEIWGNLIDVQLGEPTLQFTNFAYGAPVPVRVATPSADFGGAGVKVVYKYDGPGTCALTLFVDNNGNSLDGWIRSTNLTLAATGPVAGAVTVDAGGLLAGLTPGSYLVGGLIAAGGNQREFYAASWVDVAPDLTLSWRPAPGSGGLNFDFTAQGLGGAAVALQASVDLHSWTNVMQGSLSPRATNGLVGGVSWTNVPAGAAPAQFFRVIYP